MVHKRPLHCLHCPYIGVSRNIHTTCGGGPSHSYRSLNLNLRLAKDGVEDEVVYVCV